MKFVNLFNKKQLKKKKSGGRSWMLLCEAVEVVKTQVDKALGHLL